MKISPFITRLKTVKPEIVLFGIVIFALLLRLYFFVGINYAQDQDEVLYYTDVNAIMKGCFHHTFSNLPKDFQANPTQVFEFRYVFLFATLLSFYLFGVNDFSIVLFSFVCSIGLVVLTFYMGRLFVNNQQALLASLLCALFPLNILYSSRLLPDVPYTFFMWLSLYALLKGERFSEPAADTAHKRMLYFFISGLLIGVCYLIKQPVLNIFALVVYYLIYRREISWSHAPVMLGFLCIIIPEGIYYTLRDEPFFLNILVVKKVWEFKFLYEVTLVDKIIPGVFHLIYTDGDPCFIPKLIIRSLSSLEHNFYGYFWPVIIVSTIYAFVRKDKSLHLMAGWLCVIVLLHGFGPCRLSFNTNGALLNYYLVFQRERYLLPFILPAVILIVSFLAGIRMKLLSRLIFLILVITSLISTNSYTRYFRAGITALDRAYDYLSVLPGRRIYTDHFAVPHLQFRFGFKRDSEISNFSGVDKTEKGYLVVGGSRGMDVSNSYLDELAAPVMKKRTSSWKLLTRIENPAKQYDVNARDLLIYSME